MGKHIKAISRKPTLALDVDDLPVDIQFIVDLLNTILLKKQTAAQ